MFIKLLNYTEPANSIFQAVEFADALRSQSGCLGVRILCNPPRADAMFPLDGHDFGDFLPDGLAVRLCPDALLRQMAANL